MATQRLKLQIGVEKREEGKEKPEFRLTPIDQVLPDLPDGVEDMICGLALMADGRDAQPGDGEVDLPLNEAMKKVMGLAPAVAGVLPKEANAFIRISKVA